MSSPGSADAAPQLHHVTVVGGTLAEWAALDDAQWAERMSELGKVVDHLGARWLTLRPYGSSGSAGPSGSNGSSGDEPVTGVARRERSVGSCRVVADPELDGRARIAAAVEALRVAGEPVDERTIGARLNAPAEAEVDLVVVLGPPDRLPSSLVWELAYSELVFLDASWRHLGASHIDEAVADYAHRHRRFGGID